MHELGVMCSVIKTIENIAVEEKLTKIQKIVLQVGELSGMVPSYIEDCFPAATYKTSLEGAELELEIIPGEARCRECDTVFNALKYDLKCPKCSSDNLEALTGREFIIKEIIAY